MGVAIYGTLQVLEMQFRETLGVKIAAGIIQVNLAGFVESGKLFSSESFEKQFIVCVSGFHEGPAIIGAPKFP